MGRGSYVKSKNPKKVKVCTVDINHQRRHMEEESNNCPTCGSPMKIMDVTYR
jgi:uncharacterized protein with PIN domain